MKKLIEKIVLQVLQNHLCISVRFDGANVVPYLLWRQKNDVGFCDYLELDFDVIPLYRLKQMEG